MISSVMQIHLKKFLFGQTTLMKNRDAAILITDDFTFFVFYKDVAHLRKRDAET